MENTLETVKALDWANSAVSCYIVRRKLLLREAQYDILEVNVDENLRRKLRDKTSTKIQSANTTTEYDFNTADQDENLLDIPTAETDFQVIVDKLTSVDTVPVMANDIQQLVGAWLYISRFDIDGQPPLFAARKISDSWKAKKVQNWMNVIFQDCMLVDLEEEQVLRIDGQVDFFTFNGTTFIADKRNFETALNFRLGMERNRDELIQEFQTLAIFENPESIAALVGNNLRLLRRICQLKKSGYYRDSAFLNRLKEVNEEQGWGLEYTQHGQIIVSETHIDTILWVLNNARLTSLINDETFDASVKHRVGE